MPDLFTIAHGAGGLWEVHKWNNSLELNTELTAGEDRYWVRSIEGLHSLPDRPDATSPKVGRIGENLFPTSPSGKTVTYHGEIQASSTVTLRAKRTTLLAAFADTTTYGTMDLISQYEPVYPAVDNSPTARFYARVLQLEVGPEEQTSDRFIREFLLGLRLIDPRIYFLGLAVDQSSVYSVSVTNTGTAPADPIIRITGASGTVVVTDGTHTLTFQNCPSGTLVIDFQTRSATVSGVQVELVVADSDWWDSHVAGIAGGATVTVTQSGGGGIEVQFVPSVWG